MVILSAIQNQCYVCPQRSITHFCRERVIFRQKYNHKCNLLIFICVTVVDVDDSRGVSKYFNNELHYSGYKINI